MIRVRPPSGTPGDSQMRESFLSSVVPLRSTPEGGGGDDKGSTPFRHPRRLPDEGVFLYPALLP
jgi:hypothetical protein